MNERLELAKKKAKDAITAFHQMLLDEQSVCEHEHQIETPFKSSEYVGPFWPRRICADCGYEEEAYHFSGKSRVHSFFSGLGIAQCPPEKGHTMSTTLNAEYVKTVDRDEFYSYRPGRGLGI